MATMTAEEFAVIVHEMLGSKATQAVIAKTFDLSQPSISNYLKKGHALSSKATAKVMAAKDAFDANGGEMPEEDDDGKRPFVQETWARDRDSGRLYPMDKVNAGLVGTTKGKILTDEQISARIAERFSIMNRMVRGVIGGFIPAMIIYGAPGIGKTWDVEKALREANETSGLTYDVISGGCSASGLYCALYRQRNGGVVVLDDCDVFKEEETLNILKAALNSAGERRIAWSKKSSWVTDKDEEDDQGRIPDRFNFKGSVIFITNNDFQEMIAKGSKISDHLNALMSRSLYLDLTLKTAREKLIRIRQVFLGSMYQSEGLTHDQAAELMKFVEDNVTRWYELSLRQMNHLCQIYRLGEGWQRVAEVTKMKQ